MEIWGENSQKILIYKSMLERSERRIEISWSRDNHTMIALEDARRKKFIENGSKENHVLAWYPYSS